MPWWASLSALFLVVSLVGGAAVLAARALAAWQAFRAFARSTGEALDAVARSGEAVEEHAVALAAGSEHLTAATARLQASLAEAAVLRRALGEPQQLIRRLRGAVPHT